MRYIERRRPRSSTPAVWRRFQVTQVHELRQRLRIVPPIVAGLLVVSSLTLAVRYPGSAVYVLAANGLAGLVLLIFRPLAGVASPRGLGLGAASAAREAHGLNDERGHAAGDSTLRSVAIELQRQVRGRDSVYRIGGEEFLVLLRDTTLEGGLQVAERIRLAIAELELPSSGGPNPTHLTISGGVAVADELATSWDVVVASADASMYRAKAAGRNRVFGPNGASLLVA